MTSRGENIIDIIFYLFLTSYSSGLIATGFLVFSLYPTPLVVITPPAHLAAWQIHILTDLKASVTLQIFIECSRGRDLCWVLSSLAAASVLWPSASPGQGLSDSWRVHRCFRFLKNYPEMPFFNKALLKLGLSIILRKGKINKYTPLSTDDEFLCDIELEEKRE